MRGKWVLEKRTVLHSSPKSRRGTLSPPIAGVHRVHGRTSRRSRKESFPWYLFIRAEKWIVASHSVASHSVVCVYILIASFLSRTRRLNERPRTSKYCCEMFNCSAFRYYWEKLDSNNKYDSVWQWLLGQYLSEHLNKYTVRPYVWDYRYLMSSMWWYIIIWSSCLSVRVFGCCST